MEQKPFNAVRQTVINILLLPLAIAVLIAISLLLIFLGDSTPHEASFGDAGVGLIFVVGIIAAVIFWLCWMLFSIVKHAAHRGFVITNVLLLLSPVFVFMAYRSVNVFYDNQAAGRIKEVTVPVKCEQRQLFSGGEHIVGAYRSADTVYLVTGVVETNAGDTAFTFKYNDATWKGFAVIKQIGVRNSKVDDSYSMVLGSLKYYAFTMIHYMRALISEK
jgi:hypothetical protein